MLNALKRWSMRRKTANQLYAMTDRELSDIGIGRGDIRRVAYEL